MNQSVTTVAPWFPYRLPDGRLCRIGYIQTNPTSLPHRRPGNRISRAPVFARAQTWFPYRLPAARFRLAPGWFLVPPLGHTSFASTLVSILCPELKPEQSHVLGRNLLIFCCLPEKNARPRVVFVGRLKHPHRALRRKSFWLDDSLYEHVPCVFARANARIDRALQHHIPVVLQNLEKLQLWSPWRRYPRYLNFDEDGYVLSKKFASSTGVSPHKPKFHKKPSGQNLTLESRHSGGNITDEIPTPRPAGMSLTKPLY